MKKKGFTLIELLAVIIILAIVALIATPIILNVVEDAKDSAAKTEAAMIVSGVNNYCAASIMKEHITGEDSICSNGVTPDEVKKMVDLGNAKVNTITFDGKVTYLKVESNDRIVTYNGSEYFLGDDAPTETTYAAYSVGDDVTLTDGTTWVVVKDTTTSESEIKLMSTSNIHPNLTTETGTAMFVPASDYNNYYIAFDVNGTPAWETSTLKEYLNNTVRTRIETSLNTTISDITIWGTEELTALGCTFSTYDGVVGYGSISCDNTVTWYSKVFENTRSWTKIHLYITPSDPSPAVWGVEDDGEFIGGQAHSDSWNGARPVITVSKDVIQ